MAINTAAGLSHDGSSHQVQTSRLIVSGHMNPSQDLLWAVPFNSQANGGNGVVTRINWYMNHWDNANWYKYNEAVYFHRGGGTIYQRVLVNENAGTGGASWSNGHLDITLATSGGTTAAPQRWLIQYDADGAPPYGSSYLLEIYYTGILGPVTIS